MPADSDRPLPPRYATREIAEQVASTFRAQPVQIIEVTDEPLEPR